MKKSGGHGANTQTGISFESRVDIITYLHDKVKGYECKINKEIPKNKSWVDIYYNNKFVASSFKKNSLYLYLEKKGVSWKKKLSKRLLPDDAIYVIKENTVFVIEVKYQEVSGSVDEKLQTCHFKLRQYKKLFSELNYEVKYIYILNDWFKKDEYKDTLDFIIDMNCQYYFNYLPLKKIGLPVPIDED